jgi:iron complex transport system ATP-binding protein
MNQIIIDKAFFRYGAARTLSNICCTFSPGKFYSILGPNGSGKTTLLDLICGFLTPTRGEIRIDHTPVATLSKKELSRKIALVSQDYAINFPFRVKEIVMMGRHPYIPRFSQPSDNDRKIAAAVMKQCGITHLENRKVTELSGGEKQRCIFARALCQDTPILILDEAFSNMDICHTLQMLHLVKQAVKQQNRIVISVFHDLNLASAWSDDVLMLKNGRTLGFGPSSEMFTRETIQEVFNIESTVEYNPHARAKQIYFPAI